MTDTLENLTDSDLLALLEGDYRRQLRWYPEPWRAVHGDALIGTLLDEAEDTDRFTLQPGEWRSFAAGLTTRLDRVIMRPVRDAASTVALSVGVGVSVASFVISSWAPWGTGTSDLPAAFGPFHDAGPVLTALWAIAFLAAYVDRWWIGRIALLASIVVAFAMRPIQAQIAPQHAFSLDAGTLMLLGTSALIAALGTPRNQLPLLGAAAGWAALACLGHLYQEVIGGGPAAPPIGILLTDPARTSWVVDLALGVAAILAITRFPVAAFTILLSAVPITAALPAYNISAGTDVPPGSYLLVAAPVAAGLVLLVVASRRRSALSTTAGNSTESAYQLKRRRQAGATAAVLAPLLVLGTVASIFTVSGLHWNRPWAVNWTNYWQSSANHSLAGFEHPAASVSYRLPSGGSCTIRVEISDVSLNARGRAATALARNYLASEAANGTLLTDPRIHAAIIQGRTQQNTATNFWGVSLRYGFGTNNYNPDVEYFEAADTAIHNAINNTVTATGASPDDILYMSTQQCSGEQT